MKDTSPDSGVLQFKKPADRNLSTKERWIRKIYDLGIRALSADTKLLFIDKNGNECEPSRMPCHYQTAWYMLKYYQDSIKNTTA